MFTFSTIRSRLVALVIAVALPGMSVLIWVLAEEIRQKHRSARGTSLHLATALASRLRESAARSYDLLDQTVAHGIDTGESDCDSVHDVLDLLPHYPNLQIYNAHGEVLCGGIGPAANARYSSVAEASIVHLFKSRAPIPGDPLLLRVHDRWMGVTFRRTASRDGVFALQQFVDFDLEGYPRRAVVAVLDSRGRIIADVTNSLAANGTMIIDEVNREKFLTRYKGSGEITTPDGTTHQYGFHRVDGTDWRVFVGIRSRGAMAEVRTRVVRSMGIIAFLTAAVMMLAVWLASTIEKPLASLARAAQRVHDEGYTTSVDLKGPREVAVVADVFNRMVERRSLAEAAAETSRQQLQAFSKRLIEVQEEDCNRIAREIHDQLGQLLTAAGIDVGALVDSVGPLTPQQQALATRIRNALDVTQSSVRRIAAELRPPALDDFGLFAAIEGDVRIFQQRTGIECHLVVPDELRRLGSEIETTIYRIVQEAMTNIALHANARHVSVVVRMDSDAILLEIADDGRGITPDQLNNRHSLGIVGMKERARRINALLTLEAQPGSGTTLRLRVPLPREARKGW